jgi:hypothetical protein
MTATDQTAAGPAWVAVRVDLIGRMYPADPFADLISPGLPPPKTKHRTLHKIIGALVPRAVLAVGWSLDDMPFELAAEAERLGLGTQVICLDTWVGGPDLILNDKRPGRAALPGRDRGDTAAYSGLRDRVVESGLAHRIIPMAATFPDGLRILRAAGIAPELAVLSGAALAHDAPRSVEATKHVITRDGVMLLDAAPRPAGDVDVGRVAKGFAAATAFHLWTLPRWRLLTRNATRGRRLSLATGARSGRIDLVTRPILLPKWRAASAPSERLRNARVFGLDWLVLAPGRPVLVSPDAHKKRFHAIDSKGIEVRYRRPALRLPRDVPAIVLGGYYGFYHHLADYMLRLFSDPTLPRESALFLTGQDRHPFHEQMRRYFDLPEDRMVFVPENGAPVFCPDAIVPASPVRRLGNVVDRAALGRLHDHAKARSHAGASWPRRIFVSRDRAGRRRLADEGPLWHALEREGFARVQLETLDFADQAAMFSHAEVIVGLHGAGFANIVFTPPGAKLVELMPLNSEANFYSNLAVGCGLDFARVPVAGEFNGVDLRVEPAAVLDALGRR